MAGIREPFEIIDKATAPLNRMADAFGGAAAQAQGLDVATAGSNASLDALSASVNGISGKLTAGFSQVVTVLTEISTRIKDANAAMTAMSSTASASITGGVTQPAERAAEAEKAMFIIRAASVRLLILQKPEDLQRKEKSYLSSS
jgi:hypothetical protein